MRRSESSAHGQRVLVVSRLLQRSGFLVEPVHVHKGVGGSEDSVLPRVGQRARETGGNHTRGSESAVGYGSGGGPSLPGQ